MFYVYDVVVIIAVVPLVVASRNKTAATRYAAAARVAGVRPSNDRGRERCLQTRASVLTMQPQCRSIFVEAPLPGQLVPTLTSLSIYLSLGLSYSSRTRRHVLGRFLRWASPPPDESLSEDASRRVPSF